MRLLRFFLALLFLIFSLSQTWANHSTFRNDTINTMPDSNTSSFRANSRIMWDHEVPDQAAERGMYGFTVSGGIHATSASLTSAAFATVSYTPERVNQTATAITYAASANDVCWVIISSDNNGITGWTRVGSTAYYYKCEGDTTPNQPALPPHSTWLMQLTITSSAIAAVIDKRVSFSGTSRFFIDITDPLYGATCDGSTDDTAAIQSAVNTAPNGSIIYTPAGTCLINNSTGIELTSRTGLTLLGAQGSIWKRHGSASGTARLLTCTSCDGLTIEGMTFDVNGITSFGGLSFITSSNLRIRNNHIYDSNPSVPGANDRYALVCSGANACDNTWIIENLIEYLQVEIDQSHKVFIVRNIIYNPIRTAGIGIFSQGNSSTAADYLIDSNILIWDWANAVAPSGGGIVVDLDPNSNNDVIYQRFSITNNICVFTTKAGACIFVGTTDNTQATSGNIFEDFRIEANTASYAAGLTLANSAIFLNSSATAAFTFNRFVIADNHIYLNNINKTGIDNRKMVGGSLRNNTIHGSNISSGVTCAVCQDTNAEGNTVIGTVATGLGFSSSVSGNIIGTNRVLGTASTARITVNTEDVLHKPVQTLSAASGAVTVINTTTETTIFTQSIPAYRLEKTSQVRSILRGSYKNNNGGASAATMTIRAYFDSTVVGTCTLTQATVDANSHYFDCEFVTAWSNADATNITTRNGYLGLSTPVWSSGSAGTTIDRTATTIYKITVQHDITGGANPNEVQAVNLNYLLEGHNILP